MKYFLLILTGIVLLSCGTDKESKALPYIGNYDLEYKLVDGKEVVDTVYPTISYFWFYNEDSIRVSSKDLKGKVWIADFFFTTCSTICPRMTSQMKRLNSMTEDISEHLQFISFSINPKYDGPSQLKKYKANHGIKAKNWVFLTGDEVETHRIGIEEFRIFAGQDDMAEDGYAHSEAFTLVDKEGYVRGVYNIQDPQQVDQMNKDIRKLLEIEYGIK
jgi:protein SCO1/2